MPTAFADRGTTPEQVAGMLAFIFNLESLALSLGCNRSQLLIAIQQSAPATDDPNKIGLMWSAEWLLGLRTVETIREFFAGLLENPLALSSFPGYVNGFLLALKFTSLVARLVVELLSRAFEKLPDAVLMPWLPGLLMTLRPHGEPVLPALLKEAATCFPATLPALRDWRPPWETAPATPSQPTRPAVELTEDEAAVQALLREQPATTESLARLFGADPVWPEAVNVGVEPQGTVSGEETTAQALLAEYPETINALAALIERGGP
jgi:hypothetical protein